MTKDELFSEAADHIQGTCMLSPFEALSNVAEYKKLPFFEITQEMEDEFEKYLENAEIVECDICGWYGYAGDSNPCSDCEEELDEEDF